MGRGPDQPCRWRHSGIPRSTAAIGSRLVRTRCVQTRTSTNFTKIRATSVRDRRRTHGRVRRVCKNACRTATAPPCRQNGRRAHFWATSALISADSAWKVTMRRSALRAVRSTRAQRPICCRWRIYGDDARRLIISHALLRLRGISILNSRGNA